MFWTDIFSDEPSTILTLNLCLMNASNFVCYSLNGQQHVWRQESTSARERALQYLPGQRIHGFTVKEVGVMVHFSKLPHPKINYKTCI